MPEDIKPVVATPVVTPETTPPTPQPSGREMLRTAKIDYSEDDLETNAPASPQTPVVVATPAVATPAVVTPPVKDPKDIEIERLRAQERLATLEAEREKTRAAMLEQQRQQERQAAEATPPVDVAQLFQEDPIAAMKLVAEQTAIRVRQETLAEMEAQQANQDTVENWNRAVHTFNANIAKVRDENKELSDPNHRLTQIYLGLEKEFPHFLAIPEGPIKAIEIAKQRYELEQLKAAQTATPAQVSEAVKQGQAIEAKRQESVGVASMVAGSSRGVPPSPSVKLTPEEEHAARRLRLTPEAYQQFKPRSPKYFKKEEAPRRKVG